MKQFDSRQDLLKMLQKYMDGEATKEEKEFLESYYQSFDHKPEILNEYSEEEKEKLGSEMEAYLLRTIERGASPEIVPLWSKYRLGLSAAASILVIFSLGLIFYATRNRPRQVASHVAAPVDFSPGGDKAILTLSDGTTVVLDSISNGRIADPGGVRINKNKEGQLVYSSPDDALHGGEEVARLNRISTPVGGQYQIVLPDGSKVWLNAKSSIQFPTFFSGKERRVKITGECYFEIAKNKDKPFLVDVNGMQEIVVTGTHFNVNSYDDESAIRTSLLEGSVHVKFAGKGMDARQRRSIMLKPGDQSSMIPNGDLRISQVNMDEVVAWKNGVFEFKKTSLEMVMRQISRWYNVEITYEKNIPSKVFSGKIHRSVNASQILEILRFAGVNFRMEAASKDGTNGRIVVMP